MIDVNKVVELAKDNRSEFIRYQQRIMESNRDLDKVKKDNSFNMNVFAAYGLTQTASNVDEVYQDLLYQETIRVGVRVPIVNWGKSKANIKQQKANSELIQNQVEQAKKDFERYIFTSAYQFNIMFKKIKIAKKAMIVAKRRYSVSKQLYLIGKSDILSFNNSLQEHNQAIDSYYQIHKEYWVSYYSIRKLTHFDFVNNIQIEQLKIK
jgi:outer membrane protein TolC